jgi:arylmalonate decarboxylase
VIPKVANAAKELRDKGAQGIALMGTSLTFYKGADFNRSLTQSMREATGLPCVTMSTAIIEGLKAVNEKRVAVATAYQEEVNRRLVAFLNESGFQVDFIRGLSIENIEDLDKVTDDQLMVLCSEVCGSAPNADSLLISCGGLVTLRIHVALEKQFKVPVVSSTPAALWAAMRMMGHSGRAPGFGRLMEL